MDLLNTLHLITLLGLNLLSGASGQAPISLSVSPSSMITPGQSVSFQCTIDTTQISLLTNSIVWKRQTGSIFIKVGVDNSVSIDDEFSSQNRYSIERSRSPDGRTEAFTLKISGASVEDSGTIICGVHGSLRESSLPLAVCEDTKAYSCECIMKTYGWASPECFSEPPDWRDDRAGHNRTIIGLGVCLAIAVMFGIVMAVMVGRDCMQKMYEKEKRKQEKQKKLRQNGVSARRSAYSDSEVLQLDPNDTGSMTNLKDNEMRNYEDATDSGRASTSGSSPPPEDKSHPHQHTYPVEMHANKAYEAGEDDGYSSVNGERGARPKTGAARHPGGPVAPARQSRTPQEKSAFSAPAASQGVPPPRYNDVDSPQQRPAEPYSYPSHNQQQQQYPAEPPQTPSDKYNPAQGQYSSPGAISSISYSDRPSYPQADVPARGAYTDRPKEKRPKEQRPSASGDQYQRGTGHTDPRRLEFQGGQSAPFVQDNGPQIDSGSTMI